MKEKEEEEEEEKEEEEVERETIGARTGFLFDSYSYSDAHTSTRTDT